MKNVLKQMEALKLAAQKSIAWLIDPDKFNQNTLTALANCKGVDFILVGGSLITHGNIENTIQQIKAQTSLPTIIFPGSANHIAPNADAILLLSLISGRNPEYLIGQHVQAAPLLKQIKIEVLSTGYILIDGGNTTTVSYISNTTPIPAAKHDVAAATAMAAEFIGHKLVYLDAGSGANNSISEKLVQTVAASVSLPLLVGGGIRSAQTAKQIWNAGANTIIVGNAIEDNYNLISDLVAVKNELNSVTQNH
jgi:phosphoglycerol geranylgeranyltransferase